MLFFQENPNEILLHKGDKVGIVGCSNAQLLSYKPKIEVLLTTITEMGLVPMISNCIYQKYSIFSGTAEERAHELLRFYTDTEIKAIFDISGGDVANEILEYVDFDLIKGNPKPYFGYSDLTTIINAIYTKTGEAAYLYQIRNLIYRFKELQMKWFTNSLLNGEKDIFDIDYSFIQGNKMEGIVVGGNIRCLLKLAGTPYMPDFDNKILFLEAYSGDVALITALFSQLKQMGAFSKINGLFLGTFTYMEENNLTPTAQNILQNILKDTLLPIAITKDVGHRTDSKCIAIGKYLSLAR